MQRFLSNLIRHFRTTKTAGPARRAPRRANLQLEGLEDRTVPTTVSFNNSILTINASPIRQITLMAGALGSGAAGQVLISDSAQGLVGQVKISAIKAVTINLAGGDHLVIDDSNGMPFPTGTAMGTAISLQGVGTNNTLFLQGSQSINDNELYVAGGLSFTPGEIEFSKLKLTFQLHSALTSVVDLVPITGTLDVQTSGTAVSLINLNGATQTLTGMGFGGGDNLTFASKPTVTLETYAVGAHVLLNAAAPATSENFFEVNMHGVGDVTTIAATPRNVFTDVSSVVAPVANPALVVLQANAGAVSIEGNASTSVQIGQATGNGLSTQGIQANVTVTGAGSLFLSDTANQASQHVTVTQSTIDGMFGNISAFVTYLQVGTLTLQTGQGTDQYDVHGSLPNSVFNTQISIEDESTSQAGFFANVSVQPDNHLHLRLTNEHPQIPAQLFLFTGNGTVITSKPAPGVEQIDVLFAGHPPSQLVVTDFTHIGE